jgi:ribonuclease D
VSVAPDATATLAELAELARASGTLAFDTEFMGEGRYRTLLCLIQIAAPNGQGGARIEIIDPLRDDLDGSALASVLADPAVEIVVHAGRQDIALVRRRFAAEVNNVFDTQLAAGFAGLPAQASYDSLLHDVLGTHVAKSASYTRWDTRPLSAEQLGYAREDVVHLLELAAELQQRLRDRGRLEWARQECQTLAQASDERDPDTIYSRLPRVRGLRPESQGVARELVEWRERSAAHHDRPVQSVLGDAALVELAKRRPATLRDLEQIRGLHPGSLRRRGAELLAAVERGRRRPPTPSEDTRRPPAPDADDAPLIALCESLARARARDAGLAYELVAARADLQAIVGAWRARLPEPEVRTLQGWRRQLVGQEVLALLNGEVTLSVDGGRLQASAG